MEYYNNIVCVTYADLTSDTDGSPIIKEKALKQMLWKHSYMRVSEGKGLGNYARIDYYALPERYRVLFESKYGDPRELLDTEIKQSRLRLETDERARDFFKSYTYEKQGHETSLPDRLVDEYTLNASVLNRLSATLAERRTFRKSRSGCLAGIWDTIQNECEELRDAYGHTLPGTLQRLKRKMSEYSRDGYRSLVSGKMGNSNTLAITEEAGSLLVALKRSSDPVYTDSQILKEYNIRARAEGWRSLKGVRSLKQYLYRPDIEPLWYDAVHGELKSHQRYGRKNRTEAPSMRDSLWYGDGTRLNLYYRDYVDGRGWTVKTMSVYEVIDAYSEAMLGYHISETEDNEAQYNAFRMAVQVSGHRPYELVHDNQGGHKKIAPWLDRLARVRRPTAPYSGQSKTIESVFGRFQAQILHRDWRFTGQNITARKASSRPNLERIKANVDKLYTLDELKEAYSKARAEWNASAHHATGISRMEMYLSSSNPESPAVTVEDMVDLFWLTTARASTYTDSGITIRTGGRAYSYEVLTAEGAPDHEFLRKNIGSRFRVKYDPSDMMSVRLYSEDPDGSLRFVRTASPYIRIHRAIQDQKEGERAFIASNIEANTRDRIERQIAARAIERVHGMSMEEQGLKRPAMAGMPKNRDAEIEIEREVGRRTRKYSSDAEGLEPGRVSKHISNMLHDQLPGVIQLNPRRVVGKL